MENKTNEQLNQEIKRLQEEVYKLKVKQRQAEMDEEAARLDASGNTEWFQDSEWAYY